MSVKYDYVCGPQILLYGPLSECEAVVEEFKRRGVKCTTEPPSKGDNYTLEIYVFDDSEFSRWRYRNIMDEHGCSPTLECSFLIQHFASKQA